MKVLDFLFIPPPLWRISHKTIILVVILTQLHFIVIAQDNTLYHIPVIPQANQLNPALIHRCRVYVELPVISSIKLNIRNTGFGFHDAVHSDEATGPDVYFLDLEKLDRKLRSINYFMTYLDVDLLGIGFPVKDWYFTFGINHHTSLRLSYPDDIVTVKDGNWDVDAGAPIPISFSGLGIDISMWNSIGISAAREVNDQLTAGLRLKYLQGMANLNTRRSQLDLNTLENPVALEAEARYLMNVSFPVVLGYNNSGLVDEINLDNVFGNITGDFIFNKNRGAAIDAGIVFDYDDNIQLSASITDLGFIRWKKNVNNFNAEGSYSFTGIDIDRYQSEPGQADLLQALQDSLFRAFTAEGTTKGYFTMAPVRVFGGITYKFLPKLNAGAMTRIEFYDLNIRPSLTLSMNYTPIPSLAATLSYTVMNNKFDQAGAGLVLGNRGAQFYILTDNIPVRFTGLAGSPVFWPYNARMLSLRFGFNLLFGCNQKDSKGRSHRPGSRKGTCPAYW